MSEIDNMQKKTNEKKPTTFRIESETADKLRLLCRDFDNQDTALNALMAVFERESIINAQPRFSEDARLFEQYQKCLSAKFTDILKALATADERAKADVQQLLDSKDGIIQDLQKQISEAVSGRKRYEDMYSSADRERKELEKSLKEEKMISEGLRSEMEQKENQYSVSLQDKMQLNDMLSKTISRQQEELETFKRYPELIEEKNALIEKLTDKIRLLEDNADKAEYEHRLALLEEEKQQEAVRNKMRREHEEQMNRQRGKREKELEKLRGRLEAAQARIQELMTGQQSS